MSPSLPHRSRKTRFVRLQTTLRAMGATVLNIAVLLTAIAGTSTLMGSPLDLPSVGSLLALPFLALSTAPEARFVVRTARSAALEPLSDSAQRVVAPVEHLLRRHNIDTVLTSRIAMSLVRESVKNNISVPLMVGVLLVENPDLLPRARSKVGARGLFQVMPMHAGRMGCGSANLDNIETNICHGVKLYSYLEHEAHGNTRSALLRYNGCRRGTNTPDCRRYPTFVLRNAEAARSLIATYAVVVPAVVTPVDETELLDIDHR